MRDEKYYQIDDIPPMVLEGHLSAPTMDQPSEDVRCRICGETFHEPRPKSDYFASHHVFDPVANPRVSAQPADAPLLRDIAKEYYWPDVAARLTALADVLDRVTAEDIDRIREAAATVQNDYRVYKDGREDQWADCSALTMLADWLALLLPPRA